MSSSQVGKGEDASTPMLSSGAGQAHVIRMDPNTTNFQSSVSTTNPANPLARGKRFKALCVSQIEFSKAELAPAGRPAGRRDVEHS